LASTIKISTLRGDGMTTSESGVMGESESQHVIFLGVSTGKSLVNIAFSAWATCLGKRLALDTKDLPLQSEPKLYRQFVTETRRAYPNVRGALITSHKARVFDSAADLFDHVTPIASRLGEIGMVYWRDDCFVGDANDAVSTRAVSRRLLSTSSAWKAGSKRALILGGGGAGVALANTLSSDELIGCAKITITEESALRAELVRSRIATWKSSIPIEVLHITGASDDLLLSCGPGGLVANATGLGKDRAGNPLSCSATFPERSHVWEFNYRFTAQAQTNFYELALRQAEERDLLVEDGWDYFVWGWLVVLANAIGAEPSDYYACFRYAADAAREQIS